MKKLLILLLINLTALAGFEGPNKLGLCRKWYISTFIAPNKLAETVLKDGQILAPYETPNKMVERVVSQIAAIEEFPEPLDIDPKLSTYDFAQKLGELMDNCSIVFSTPIMTNVGKLRDRPLSENVFGYINLAKFVNQDLTLDFNKLKSAIYILTRALDDLVEINIDNCSTPETVKIIRATRKIGIGVCGFTDMLKLLGLPYADKKSKILLQDILSLINYQSKVASFELARHRGSFDAINESKYLQDSFILDKYSKINTKHVSTKQWTNLAKKIRLTKLLRNCTETVSPTKDKSALIIGASQL